MTNQQAKELAIKKAYGEFYNELKPFINKDGWISGDDALYTKYNRSFRDIDFSNPFGNQSWRPIELSNLEDNRGWTRIEPDGSNFPENGLFKMCKEIKKGEWWYSHDDVEPDDVEEYFRDMGFTHYKPITPELKPIY